MENDIEECISCPKEEILKNICRWRAYPFSWPYIASLNKEGKCKWKEKLIKKGSQK